MKRPYSTIGQIELCRPQCEVKDYAIGSQSCRHCEYYVSQGKDWVECSYSPKVEEMHYIKMTKIMEK